MSNHKLSLQGFFHKLGSLYRKITRSFVNSLLRYVLLYQRRGKLSTAGFILPTTVLLILVVALTVGALTFRAYNRNVQVIGEAQQRVIYNAATPAIDRARSKLEFLFDPTKETRLPSGVPSQGTLEAILLNNGTTRDGATFAVLPYKDAAGVQTDAYTFPDETRIDINKDNKVDNAWYFRTDTSGDGKLDSKDSTVVYSIIVSTPPATEKSGSTPAKSIATTLLETPDDAKANSRWVRQSPLSVDGALGCKSNPGGGSAGPDGWFEDKISTSILRKNLQVDALVIPGTGGTKATLEFTQDRQLDRGNKWGAWFRHDLEIYPGPSFNWNGAMHTEGSLIVGGDKVTAYLISSPSSCLYNPASNSEITVTDVNRGTAKTNLLGLVAAGSVKNGTVGGTASIHIYSSNPQNSKAQLNATTASSAAKDPFQITIDPETVLLENGYTNVAPIGNATKTDRSNRGEYLKTDANKDLVAFGKTQSLPQRISAQSAPTPYVDDLYRADDRWGPKPKYSSKDTDVVPEGDFGKPIPSSNTGLLNNNIAADDADAAGAGLDGYWERRARLRGLRILVGQRLELGNLFTWYAPTDKNSDNYVGYSGTSTAQLDQAAYEYEGDPLYPVTVKPYPTASSVGRLSHVDLQRRSLRDNLSAIQSTAIYHAAADQKDYPVACFATTSHPGTLWTIRQALTFRPFSFTGTEQNGVASSTPTSLLTNFFTGVGTNGWEFEPPAKDVNTYNTQIQDPNSALRKALQNLANFAGDYQTVNGSLKSGAFPPTPNDTVIHPYPALSMWGNYSNLKRALTTLSANSNTIANLSIADQTYLQTAACTLGMLAYNIDQIQKFDPSALNGSNAANDRILGSSTTNPKRLMAKLGADLWLLMDGENDLSRNNPEVLPKEQLGTYLYSASGTLNRNAYQVADYQSITPEALIAALRQHLLARGTATNGTRLKPDDPEFIDEMRMAEMIMLNHQIRRDRTFGFKPSPRFGQYSIVPPQTLNPVRMATACDPDQFVFTSGTDGDANLRGFMRGDDNISKASTVLSAGGLTAVSLPSAATDYPKFFSTPMDSNNVKRELSYYRLALSRLCGTLDANGAQVLPKFPALYYLFPEAAHDYDGGIDSIRGYNHQQPTAEPYIADSYIQSINAQFSPSNLPFQPISTEAAKGRAGYPSAVFSVPASNPAYDQLSRKPDTDSTNISSVRVFPIADLAVSGIALNPRPLNQWQLPYLATPRSYDTTTVNNSTPTNDKANFSTDIILNGTDPSDVTQLASITPDAVPFLDRAFFDGRQLMMTRTLDIDLGMLRSNRFGSKNDVWLPISGIVYAFREDAVREDAISRPACTGTGCEMDLRDPLNPVDPAVRPVNPTPPTRTTLNAGENGISTKAIDKYPDPDRRIYGFRLRNGVQVMRNRSFEGTGGFVNAADNIRGLSLFTDQPVYIQGSFNLHQSGNDDTMGTLLEEFTTLLASDHSNFYSRSDPDPNFAKPSTDRWRPSEILADSISILSNGFCDGSIADAFLQYQNQSSAIVNAFNAGSGTYPVPDTDMLDMLDMDNASNNRSYYHSVTGLFDPGCISANYTSFHNQNRPAQAMVAKTAGTANGWDWVRENSRYDAVANRRMTGTTSNTAHWVDITAPVKISRAGQPFVVRPRDPSVSKSPDNTPYSGSQPPLPPVPYNIAFPSQTYYTYGDDISDSNRPYANTAGKKALLNALATRINTIIVSGISPSRPKQGYGGLHNFPRFLETWDGKDLNYAGSFIQLNYTNYSTSPFELENLEPWSGTPKPTSEDNENIGYYSPPNRRWGYDVALQFSPASPAAARFVTTSKNRSEYYVEPPANDPYIANLCEAAKLVLSLNTTCSRK